MFARPKGYGLPDDHHVRSRVLHFLGPLSGDAVPALNKHWFNVLCLQEMFPVA